jgi:hypothetical protein
MPNRSRKANPVQNKLRVAQTATGTSLVSFSNEDRSRIMAQMGSIGGKIGGKRRAATMSPEARKASASLAAKARWGGNVSSDSLKLKQQVGLKKIAQIIEQHMTDMGLSEDEKNEKTALLVSLVNETITAKLKAPAKRKAHLQMAAFQA